MTVLAATVLGGWFWFEGNQPSSEELRLLCRDASQNKQWAALLEHAERWTAIEPESGEAWMNAARALQQQKKFDEAALCLQRVPITGPDAEAALIAQLDLAFGPRNCPEEGAAICKAQLERNPHSTVAQQRLIFFLAITVQRRQLQKQIRAAIESGSEPREAYVYLFFADSLHFSNGAKWNGQWLQGNPESELFEVAQAVFIAQTLDLSFSMDNREEWQNARAALAKKGSVMAQLLKRYPHNTELLAYHLRESVKAGDVSRTLQLLSQAPVASEDDGRFWRYKGWVHAQRDELTAAEEAYRRALELHPLDWATRHLLAELCQRQQRFQEVERLRQLVTRASELRRILHTAPSAREVPVPTLEKLASYAADCGDDQMADALRKRIRQF